LLENFWGKPLRDAYVTVHIPQYNVIVCVSITSPCSLNRSSTFFVKSANYGNDNDLGTMTQVPSPATPMIPRCYGTCILCTWQWLL